MASLRFGEFKPNLIGLGLAVAFLVFFFVYILGYSSFNSAYRVLYDDDEYKAIQNMKWFVIGCPTTMLIGSVLLFVVSSFSSRQILLGFSALITLGAAGLVLIAAWIGTNISRFNAQQGWKGCNNVKECSKLKNGLNAFLAGAIVCAIICILQIVFCFLRARQIKMIEANYTSIQADEDDQNEMFGAQDDEAQVLEVEEEDTYTEEV